jgi:hypothetical protein
MARKSRKIQISSKKVLLLKKSTCGGDALTLNTPLPEATTSTNTTLTAKRMVHRDKRAAGAPRETRAQLKFFVSGSLKLIVSEEICGRFGFVSTDERLHITFLGFEFSDLNSMMKCQLHV